jgi:hypothetical protein
VCALYDRSVARRLSEEVPWSKEMKRLTRVGEKRGLNDDGRDGEAG